MSEKKIDLFEATRYQKLNNLDKTLGAKEIVQRIRKELKGTFHMCEWSIKLIGRNTVFISLMATPRKPKSKEVNAIAKYAYFFYNSYRWQDYCDPYGLIGSSFNIEGIGWYTDIISENIAQTEWEYADDVSKEFRDKLSKKGEAETDTEEITECVSIMEVNTVDYFVVDCIRLTGNTDCIADYRQTNVEEHCKIAQEVIFHDEEDYKDFANHLLDDKEYFTIDIGGRYTDDERVTSMKVFKMMDRTERESVKWYNKDCTAIFCGDTLRLIVNNYGYRYARQLFLPGKQVSNGVFDDYYSYSATHYKED